MAYYRDVTEPVTVEEVVKRSEHTRFWLCPRMVRTQKIDRNPLLQGIECSRYSVPEEIKQCKVTRLFIESNMECIIWENKEIEEKLMQDFRESLRVNE